MPTYYGDVSYTLKKEGDTLRIKVSGKAKPDKGFVFKSPFLGKKIKKVEINGREAATFSNDEVIFDKLPVVIVISCKTE